MRPDTYRRRAWELATGQYGYVTTADARSLGIPVIELGKLAARDQIRRVAYGLYRFDDLPPTRYDQFFEAVARVGGDAHLTGDAVLALHNLALVNPRQVRVGTSRRVRAKLPEWIKVVHETIDSDDLTHYELIPSATVAHALRACRGTVMSDRLLIAVGDARREGLVTAIEEQQLRDELRDPY
jgi:predicted transcriptional regulator of viral defense system